MVTSSNASQSDTFQWLSSIDKTNENLRSGSRLSICEKEKLWEASQMVKLRFSEQQYRTEFFHHLPFRNQGQGVCS